MNRAARRAPHRGFLAALRSAGDGVREVFRSEPNLRIQGAIGAAALALSLWLGTGTAAVLLASGLVIASELLNAAFERLADAVHPSPHPLVGAAKDASAGAVLVCAVAAALVGLVVLGPALVQRLAGWFG